MPLSDDDLARLADYNLEQLCAFCYDYAAHGAPPLYAQLTPADRETLYRWLIEQLAPGQPPFPSNPYRGLFAFQREDAPYFFGREAFTQQLVEAVESRRLVALLGASGSGKSSVVLAGLVPALLEMGQWQYTLFRPESDPFASLAKALVPLYETDLSQTGQVIATRALAQGLRDDSALLADILPLIQARYPQHRLLIIADQFEELYTLCKAAETRQRFLDLLLAAVDTSDALAPHFVLTLRADFLSQASLYLPFADWLDKSITLLGPMTREQL